VGEECASREGSSVEVEEKCRFQKGSFQEEKRRAFS